MGYLWYYNNSNGRPYNKYISYSALLTTVSLSGGWVPGMSKGFHFWQPAPRLNNAPWLAQCCNPAMSPHEQEAKTGTRHTEEQRKEKGGGRAIWWLLLATLADRNSTHCQTYATWVKHCTVVEVLKKTDFWPWVLLVLFAVNYKIAFKYIIKYYITALDTLAC